MSILPSKLAGLLSALSERGEVRRAGGEWRTRCPAHPDNGPSLYVRWIQETNHTLLRCNAGCDVHDILSTLDMDLAVLFLEGDTEVQVDERFVVLDEVPTGTCLDRECSQDQAFDPRSAPHVESASVDLRNEVYGSLLSRLRLSDPHRDALRRRGLDDAVIERLGYRSLERFALNQAVGRLREQHDDATLLGVPGFITRRDRVRFLDIEGMLVPVRDLQGRIVALKIRPDENADGPKYVWVSSAGEGGPSPGSPPHVPLGTPATATEVRITEGEIKADVAWTLSGLPTIGVSGVSNWRSGLPILQTLGVRVVRLAFDADARTKPGVALHLQECARELIDAGFEVALERWDPAAGKGIDDLLAGGGTPEVVTGQQVLPTLASLLALFAEDEDEAWMPDSSPSNRVAPYPVDCLTEAVAEFVTEAAESLQCPLDFLGVAVLTVAAAAIGGSRRIRIRRGYEEGARIYAAIVAAPGSAKSPALRAACAPVYAEQHRRRVQYRNEMAQYEVALETYELERRALRSQVVLGAPPDPPEKPVPPTLGHVFVGDATTEALAPILARCPRGVIMIRDELTGWVQAMDQYKGGKGADRQFFLSCWSGEAAKVDRKGDKGEPLIVFDPVLSVIGCIPPGKLATLDAGNDGEDGFVHRLLFTCPDPPPHRRWSWEGLSPQTRQGWEEIIAQLYGLEMDRDEDDQPTAVVLDLAPEAMPIWAEWYDRLQAEMESPDFSEVLVGPWAKMIGYAARLALIIHLLRTACGEEVGSDVDEESLRRALRLVEYFQGHARVVYSRMRQTREVKKVQRAIAWVRAHGGECTPTHLTRNNVAGLEKKSEAETLMRELEDRGYGRCETRTAVNHRKVLWFLARPVESGPVGSSRAEPPDSTEDTSS